MCSDWISLSLCIDSSDSLWGTDLAYVVFFSVLLGGLGLLFIYISRYINRTIQQQKQEYRIPKGTIQYTDLTVPATPLFSPRYRLTGKPDYIIKEDNSYIPVEIKSTAHDQLQTNHLYQLAAYCQLIEDQYGTFVPYGRIIYQNADFCIPFDPKIRFDLSTILQEMRSHSASDDIHRNHQDYRKCQKCSMNKYCPEKLG